MSTPIFRKSISGSLAAALLLTLAVLSLPAHAQAQARSSARRVPARQVKQYTIEQFMNTVRIGGSSFSADEKTILFHSNRTGIFNVHSVPVVGGGPTQLTRSTKESTYAVTFFHADGRAYGSEPPTFRTSTLSNPA